MPTNDRADEPCSAGLARLKVLPDRQSLGETAAREMADRLRTLLSAQATVRVMFAAAPSQSETLACLLTEPGIDWSRITAFHMDEYLGLPPEAPQRFGNWLRERLFDRLPFKAVHRIDTSGAPADAASRYASLLLAAPVDIVCLGIGANGHLAFNDPPTADFRDPAPVKPVVLDDACRRQQVDDGCFTGLDRVPESAITVTIPTLLAAGRLFCAVPGPRKAEAVRATVHAPLNTRWPSTVLRTHPDCTIYLDSESAALLDQAAVSWGHGPTRR